MNTSKHQSPVVFNQECASSIDKKYAKLAPLIAALHLCMRIVLSDLPANAQILCVGVGTGAELIALAQAFSKWRFTAVEPSSPMIDVCRQRVEEVGIAPRCTFHNGFLDTLPESDPFDAATSILVSQFIKDKDERLDFFRGIASRLRSGGYLVSADLASDISTSAFKSLLEVWLKMLKYSDLPADEIEKFRTSHGNVVAVLPPQEVGEIIASSGFDSPVLFYQTLLIHAWYSRLR